MTQWSLSGSWALGKSSFYHYVTIEPYLRPTDSFGHPPPLAFF
jgi:hypothetical protein